MTIDSIENGVVIDHIQPGKAMDIYKYLRLDKLDCSVAIIKNAKSPKQGKKDIIKIEDAVDLDLAVLGFVDPNITVNIIKNGVIAEKKRLHMPERVVNVVKCKNPRCITTIEQELEQVFFLSDREKGTYRCAYCEQSYKGNKKEI